MSQNLPDRGIEGSPAQAIAYALRLLRERDSRGEDLLREQFNQLSVLLASIKSIASKSAVDIEDELVELEVYQNEVDEDARLPTLEALWRNSLSKTEDIVSKIKGSSAVHPSRKEDLLHLLVDFESADLLNQVGPDADAVDGFENVRISRGKLSHYLRDRFNDPTIEVTFLESLSGGFGKETTLFGCTGGSLNGEFVIRREISDTAALHNDCHDLTREYELIKVLRKIGYLSPEVLWLDTEHRLLPGGHFIVMRRSKGRLGGSIFGATTDIPETLTDVLARHAARLHTLPVLSELGELTESINFERWEMSRRENVERYLRDWYRYWRSETHSPSPALAALYGWLFDHLPERPGKPALIHGDLGFHNILLEGNELSVILDWEYAHIGDPAEELAYVQLTTGAGIDWDKFMTCYLAAGGEPVDQKTLRFFQVWAHVRNASAANIVFAGFANGKANDLKLNVLPYMHIPNFICAAQALIRQE
ncbi:MAG: phosphotransferase family protein [Pseudomonadales bacterium]